MAERESKQLSIEEAMERLELSRPELYRRVKDGALKGDKVDRRLHFAAEEVERYYGVLDQERSQLQEAIDRCLTFFGERLMDQSGAVLKNVADQASVEQIAEVGNRILQDAWHQGVQDLYFDPLHTGVRLLYGAGRPREVAHFDACMKEPLTAWLAGLVPIGEATADRLGEGLVEMTCGESRCQLRLNEVPTILGPHWHLHLFTDYEGKQPVDVGYSPEQAEGLMRNLGGRPGVFLLVGSGAPEDDRNRLVLAQELAAAGRLVVCLDQRVQYRAERLVQLEWRNEGENEPDFNTLWRAALDMSPNVVVLDEVKDAVQARALLEGARSGAVVLAQMRSGSLLEAVQRLLDFEIDRRTLAQFLLGGVDKVVLRRLCPECAQRRPLERAEAVWLGAEQETEVGVAVGCVVCGDGYISPRPVYGLWPTDDRLKRWISKLDADVPIAPDSVESLKAALHKAVLDRDVTLDDARAFWPDLDRA